MERHEEIFMRAGIGLAIATIGAGALRGAQGVWDEAHDPCITGVNYDQGYPAHPPDKILEGAAIITGTAGFTLEGGAAVLMIGAVRRGLKDGLKTD